MSERLQMVQAAGFVGRFKVQAQKKNLYQVEFGATVLSGS